jgi:hypothetical protein
MRQAEMTGRTGPLQQVYQDKNAKTGLPGHDSPDSHGRRDRQNWRGKAGQAERDRQKKTSKCLSVR